MTDIMDPRKQATLLNYHKAIQDSVDINKIWTEMESIFTDKEQRAIQSQPGKEQMRMFVDVLARKDDQAFDSLVRVLRRHYRWLSTRLRQGVKDEERRVLKAEKGIRQKITLALLTARISERQKEEITSRVSHVMKEELNDKALRVSIPDHRAAAELDNVNKQMKRIINEELDPMLYGRVQDTDLTNSEIDEVIKKLQHMLVEMNVIQDCYDKLAVHSLAGHGTSLPNILRQKIEETQMSIRLLEKEKRELTKEKAQLSREKNEQRQEIADLESQNRSLELQNRTLTTERVRLDEEVRKTSRFRDSLEIEKRKIEDEKVWMESMVDNLDEEKRNYSVKNKRLLDLNHKLTRDNQKVAGENEKLRKEILGYYGTDGKSILLHDNKILTETKIKLNAELGRIDSERRQLLIRSQKMEHENENLKEQKRRLMIEKKKYWEENQALRTEAKRLALGKYESSLTLPQIKDHNRSRISVRFSDQHYSPRDDQKSVRTERSVRRNTSTSPVGRKASTHSQNNGSRKVSTHSQNNGSRKVSTHSQNNGSRKVSTHSQNNGSRKVSTHSQNKGSRKVSTHSQNNDSRKTTKTSSPNESNRKTRASASPERGYDEDQLASSRTTAYPHPKSEPYSMGRNQRDKTESNARGRSESKGRDRHNSNSRGRNERDRSESKGRDRYDSNSRGRNERDRSKSKGRDRYDSNSRGRNERDRSLSKGRDSYEPNSRGRNEPKERGRSQQRGGDRAEAKGRDRNELKRASTYDYRKPQDNLNRYPIRQA